MIKWWDREVPKVIERCKKLQTKRLLEFEKEQERAKKRKPRKKKNPVDDDIGGDYGLDLTDMHCKKGEFDHLNEECIPNMEAHMKSVEQ